VSSSIAVTVTSEDLTHLAKILSKEEDGKKLRRDLAKSLREASKPAAEEAKSAILSMDTGGLPHEGQSLRQAIAERITTEARLTGRSTGAKVKARRLATGFIHAPKRTNANKWRHQVYGNPNVWVDQVGKPRWFDDALKNYGEKWREAVVEAINAMAERIARRAE